MRKFLIRRLGGIVPSDMPERDVEQDFINAAEALTVAWAEAREAGILSLSPWIEWKTREVFITERTPPKRKAS
jgi:hypothetical protein